jgi:hypothetical protein
MSYLFRSLPSAMRISPCLFIAVLLAAASPSFADHLEKHFPVKPHPVIVIHNPKGRLVIQSWPKAEVQVVADHASDEIGIEATQKGNLIELNTMLLSENVGPDALRADYSLNVPADAELQVHNDAGFVQVLRVFGDTAVDTATAMVDLEDIGGFISVKTIGGSVDCIRCSGRIEISSFTGDLRLLQGHLMNVRMHTTNGSILFDSDFMPSGVYLVSNYSGPIELRFSPGDSFSVQAVSLRGIVNNEANLTPSPIHSPTRPPRFSNSIVGGSKGLGLAHVELSSFDGTINIRKRE